MRTTTDQHDHLDPSERPWPTWRGRPLANPDESVFDQGLGFDLQTIMDRRRALRLMGAAGIGAGLVATGGVAVLAQSLAPSASPTATAAACTVIPEETAGPYPGDGSNGPDVLSQSEVVRSDIRSSFGDYSGTAEGIPLTIALQIQDASNGCAPLAGAAVYLWHCDRDGEYSLYTLEDQNYLRGVQAADADGVVTFTSIFPGCYSGRWPHIHFEVFRDLAAATDDVNRIATSQVALPQDVSEQVYATAGYESSVGNLARLSLATDNVFGEDGGVHQLGTMSGDLTTGLLVELAVPVLTA